MVPRLGPGVAVTALVLGLLATSPANDAGAVGAGHVTDSWCAGWVAGTSGSRGVTQLGTDLPHVAALNTMSTTALTTLLSQDAAARLDRCGRLLFADPAPAASQVRASATATVTAATLGATAQDVFALSSRPESTRTLLLDFDGSTISSSAWNRSYGLSSPYTLSAFDTDGAPTSFSASEREAIRQVWLIVSEDFAPFDVNVTTRDPGPAALLRESTADSSYGLRAVITDDRGPILADCGCGGIAYVDVARIAGSQSGYFQPAIVFATNLGLDAKAIGEATSHELGHNFGLYHDGSPAGAYYAGQGAWAPIMGASYSSPVSQWSKGEYAGANQKQDDVAVIAGNAPLVADDVPDSPGEAMPLPAGVGVDALISPSDADWFSFTTLRGDVSVDVLPQPLGADLDVRADLYAADGQTLLATINPAVPSSPSSDRDQTGLDARRTFPALAAGSYLVRVTGAGQGDPSVDGYSAYGSLGRYTITVTRNSLAVSTAHLAPAVLGRSYSAAMTAAGGHLVPVSWSIVAGTLPAGLVLSGDGSVSGVPTTVGPGRFTVRATEVDDGDTADATLTLTVGSTARFSTSVLAQGTVGRPYSSRLPVVGGSGTYTVMRTVGSLPRGIALSRSGLLSGRPAATGSATFLVTISDSAGGLVTRALTLVVRSNVAFVTRSVLAPARRGRASTIRLAAALGTAPYTFRLVRGATPRGVVVTAAGRLAGRAASAGTYRFTVLVRDAGGRTATRVFALTVR